VLAREEERRRLRRDLHDGIGPALAGLTLKTETARALLPRGSDRASRQLHDLSEEIRRTVVDVRRLVEGLRPPALDELGLSGACAQAVERLTAGADLSASVRVGEDLPTLPAAVEVAAYRIVVEAVTNTASVPDRPGGRPAGIPLSRPSGARARVILPSVPSPGMLAHVIDPDSAVPPYEQVAKMLRDEIAEGTLIGRIPSIHTISEHHRVSHRTAARALSILKGEGMIVSVPGQGHFVRHPR
jgi:hypothetical protein